MRYFAYREEGVISSLLGHQCPNRSRSTTQLLDDFCFLPECSIGVLSQLQFVGLNHQPNVGIAALKLSNGLVCGDIEISDSLVQTTANSPKIAMALATIAGVATVDAQALPSETGEELGVAEETSLITYGAVKEGAPSMPAQVVVSVRKGVVPLVAIGA